MLFQRRRCRIDFLKTLKRRRVSTGGSSGGCEKVWKSVREICFVIYIHILCFSLFIDCILIIRYIFMILYLSDPWLIRLLCLFY